MNRLKFGVLTVSDSCFQNASLDKSGPNLVSLVKTHFTNIILDCVDIVPDEVNEIKAKLIEWSDINNCDVILTTGGTGFAPRDVTPEATKAVIEKEVSGISYAMLSKSLTVTAFAMLSRAVSGVRNKTLIINFPGSVKAVNETFMLVAEVIPHAVSLIQDDINDVKMTHVKLQGNIASTASKVKLDTVASRERTSTYTMVEVSEAIEIIKSVCVQDSNTDLKHIKNALGHVLAEDIRSIDPLPPFAASVKDGYAVKSADGNGKRLVCDVVAAGDNPEEKLLKKGQCVRISTGAPIPPGADAVVQVEDTELLLASSDLSKEIEINIKVAPTPGQDIRPIGCDIEAHSIVLRKGFVLNAAEVGVLATVGKNYVKVFKRLTVGIISTGNEVQDFGETLQPGCIRDSNKITLISLLAHYGYVADDCGIARDKPTLVKQTLERAFEKYDMIITTGGVSMGEFDVLKRVLIEDFEAKIHFGRINMKPGKPTTFATCVYNGNIKIVFGLPGNPVSATVTCLLFVIPALRHCENRADIMHPQVMVEATFCPNADSHRPDYQRVKLKYTDYMIIASSTGNQISSKLNSFVDADGLMLVPPQPKLPKLAEPMVVDSQPTPAPTPKAIMRNGATSLATSSKVTVSDIFGSSSTIAAAKFQTALLDNKGFQSNTGTKCSKDAFNTPRVKFGAPPCELPLYSLASNTTETDKIKPFSFGVKQKYVCYVLKKF